MSIPSGYLLKITTWENDADNYITIDIPGLTEDHTRFLIEIAKLFYSCHSRGDTQGFGNSDRVVYRDDDPIEDEEIERPKYYRQDDRLLPLAIKRVVDSHIAVGKEVPEEWDYRTEGDELKTRSDFADWYNELLYDHIGIWCEGEYWRVFESFKVYYVPDPMKDVTEQFQ